VPDHRGNLVGYEFLGHEHGLLGVAIIIGKIENDFLAEQTACCVHLRDRQPDAVLPLLATVLERPAERCCHTEHDLGPGAERHQHERGGEEDGPDPHGAAP
jgi:hypothetical protein